MSVKVDLAELAARLDSYGFGYLLTVGEDLRAHAVAVRPVLADGLLQVEGLGRRTRANLVSRPEVSLVWPPVDEGGYSLIVDGRATVTSVGATVEPGHAVLHRPAHNDGAADHAGSEPTGCGNDCVPLS
ncbi:MAG: pyridoxamine 5'-phosphate oxidase [Nocardioides sp.]